MTPTLFSDSLTIFYKEWHGWFARSARPAWLGLLLLMAMWSVATPFVSRQISVEPMLMALVWLALPMAISGAVVADSFAGECERQTLETLLASRLSDRAIVIGKIAAAAVYAVGLFALGIAPGIALVASGAAGAEVALRARWLGLWAIAIGLPLIALVITSSAIFVLYAYTARQPFLPITAFAGVLLLCVAAPVVWETGHSARALQASSAHGIVLGVLFLLDGILLAWLMVCAHRMRLLALR